MGGVRGRHLTTHAADAPRPAPPPEAVAEDARPPTISYAGGRSRPGPWSWKSTIVVLVAAAVVGVGFDRYLEWDEAVFYSQSGSFRDSGAPAAFFHASREIGPAALVRVLRWTGAELAEVRVLWAAVSLAVALYAFREIGKRLGGWTGVVGGALFVGNWLAMLMLGSFYGSFLGASFAVLACAYYLRLRDGREDSLADGLLLGLAMALAFWMRHVESAIVLACLVGDALLVRRSVIVARWRSAAAAAGVFVVAFVVPWTLDSVARYGSVARRLELAQAQGWPRGEGTRIAEYVRTLVGISDFYTPAGAVPMWAILVTGAGGLALLAGIGWMLSSERGARRSAGLLVLTVATASLAFFALYASNVRDRYTLYGVAFGCVLAGQLVDRIVPRIAGRLSVHAGTLVLVALVGYVLVQQVILGPYELARLREGRAVEGTATAMRVLAQDEPCQGIARYGSPQLQAASGCSVERQTEPDAVSRLAAQMEEDSLPAFIVWPGRDADELDLSDRWIRIDRPEPRNDVLFALR